MIRIDYKREGKHHTLTVQGHAGYDANGKDIVCAGVSAISYALLGYLHNAGCVVADAKTESGDLGIACWGGNEAFDMAMIGYLQIAKKYPQCVDVHIAGDSPDDTRKGAQKGA